jgi:hypothetical protein
MTYFTFDPFDNEVWFAEEYRDFEDKQNPKHATYWWQKWQTKIIVPATNKAAVEKINEFLSGKNNRVPFAFYKHLEPGKNPEFPAIRLSFNKKYHREVIEVTE